jgi:hypothetical protein
VMMNMAGPTDSIFNFEGGCYAKTIDLSEEKEPEIFNAIRPGALVENVQFFPGTKQIDFSNKYITENTRVSYPLDFISNALEPSIGGLPKNIFFLTCDAYGVLPPVSKLHPARPCTSSSAVIPPKWRVQKQVLQNQNLLSAPVSVRLSCHASREICRDAG